MHLCLGIYELIFLLFRYSSVHSVKNKWTIYIFYEVAFFFILAREKSVDTLPIIFKYQMEAR